MSLTIKKRVVALITTLALVVCMMVPSFAAEAPIDEESVVTTASEEATSGGRTLGIYKIKNNFAQQILNVWGTGVAAIKNGANVTTFADQNDVLQYWNIFSYSDGTSRIACNADNRFAVDYWQGATNTGNAQLFAFASDEKYSNDSLVRLGTGEIASAYHSGRYLAAKYATIAYGAHDVFWATAEQAPGNYRLWTVQNAN